ncbi:hypothetical protein HNQ91_002016 [Filimonas zeae]|uniref:Uncharacterized protein n=1 Tax=Filimonas zeae TaxID=1737353 RepID=A0A917IYU1_9BACT|nr:hypothetical protein [Filimonas zeae]MDR6338965.1 hypothetical protein [Filimonas zeae]GGH65746.1 hypothetical protein GCM10011379_19210 [Filimonas zeae]
MLSAYYHFIPKADADLVLWVANFRLKIATVGAQIELPAATITEAADTAQIIEDGFEKSAVKKQEQQEAVAYKKVLRKRDVKKLVSLAIAIKRHPLYTENMGRELGIIGTQSNAGRSPLRPTLKLKTEVGYVAISFNKQRQKGITIYSRLKGSHGWDTLISGTSVSPFKDERPLQQEGVAETREYLARYWDNATEIGQESDIVFTLFGG